MIRDDIENGVPTACQGTDSEIYERIESLGSSAILVFDNSKHIAQLQFREYNREISSPNGLWDPLYWGDFGPDAPILRDRTLSIYCYHVGQFDETEARDKNYHGLGIGKAMLEYLLVWAKESGFSGVVAKATPESRPVMSFMGGQPLSVYENYGFKTLRSEMDEQLLNVVREKRLVPKEANPKDIALVSQCIKYFE